jgi:hypothetical protein
MAEKPSKPLITPEQEIVILRARVSELERELDRARAERDDALRVLGAARSARSTEPAHATAGPVSDDACQHCEGYGSHWIHDIEMPCLKCGGTGRAHA